MSLSLSASGRSCLQWDEVLRSVTSGNDLGAAGVCGGKVKIVPVKPLDAAGGVEFWFEEAKGLLPVNPGNAGGLKLVAAVNCGVELLF